MGKTILIIAGEASGDLHGSKLARALRRERDGLRLQGVGGALMKEAGVELLGDIQELGVVGVIEVLGHWKSIWNVYRKVRERLLKDPPDLVVFIDYPDFNLRVARIARGMNIPTAYYISPQIWAWRRARIKTIARLIDKMIVIFSFEKDLYDRERVDCEFVGHPLLDDLHPLAPKADLRSHLGLDPGRPTVGLFPGSRRQEIQRMMPPMLQAMVRLKKKLPPLQFVMAVASSVETDFVQSLIYGPGGTGGSDIKIALCPGKAQEVISASDALVVASGTATLQAAIHETPMVIIYKVSPLTYLLGRILIRTKEIGLANLVAGERIVPELIQTEADPPGIEREMFKILTDPAHAERIRKGLSIVRGRLGPPGASTRAAGCMLELLDRRSKH